MLVTVGSTNPVKVEAVRAVFSRVFQDVTVAATTVDMPEHISNMPVGGQTKAGAVYRAEHALRPEAAFAVGAEGGVAFDEGEGYLVNWCAVLRSDGVMSVTSSSRLRLPAKIAKEIEMGKELGPLMEELTGRNDMRMGQGAIGYLTKGLVTRQAYFEPCLACALAPFLQPELYEVPALG